VPIFLPAGKGFVLSGRFRVFRAAA
jgi:hypothetical protein